MRLDLKAHLEKYPEICKRKFGRTYNFSALEKRFVRLREGQRCLAARDVSHIFHPENTPFGEERTWHPSQRIEKKDDGSVILSLQVADEDEVKRWLIGFGAEASVLAPEQLRQEIRQEWKAGLARER